jgi:integrase
VSTLLQITQENEGMPSVKLTKTFIDGITLSDQRTRYIDTEVPFLCVRTSATRKSFYYYKRTKEHGVVSTFLGTTDQISLAEARSLAREVHMNATTGKAPTITGVERSQQPELLEAALTGAGLVRMYLKQYAQLRKRSWKDDRNKLEYDFIPVAGKMPVSEIDSKVIREILKRPLARGKPIAQNRLHACLSKMFNWAADEELIDRSPVHGIKRKMKETQKDRVLSESELLAVWKMTALAPPLQGAAHRIMLVCLTRRGETMRARWKDIDFQKQVWVIPGSETKNGNPHSIPLSALALAEFKSLHEATGAYEYVFTDILTRSPLRPDSVTQYIYRVQRTATLRTRLGLKSVEKFTVHDFRRTAATNVGELMGSREPVRRLLNHTDPGATKVYDRHTYDRLKRQALDAWSDRLTAVVKK